METLVVGAGAMGRWFGRVLVEDAAEPVDLSFFDATPSRAQAAADATGGRAIDGAGSRSFDLVCIAVPIPAATEAIETHGPRASGAVVDVTGSMAGPVAALEKHVSCERASFHPLFAPAHEPGNVPAVVGRTGPVVDTVVDALVARGNDVFETTPDEHDRAMETVQTRTHAAILSFALAADEVPEHFHTTVSSTLTGLAEQVTAGEGRVYADIQATFDGADDVAAAARDLADADPSAFERLYDDAADRMQPESETAGTESSADGER